MTKDILSKGCFTEKAIKRALESQLVAGYSSELSTSEKTKLVVQLKQLFGLEKDNRSLRIKQNSISDSSSLDSPKKSVGVRSPVKINTKQDNDDGESFEDDLSSILRDESDMDVVELLKTTMRHKKAHVKNKSSNQDDEMPRQTLPVQTKNQEGKLFESLNLTNLNVSFNSANMHEAKRRLEESRTQALLMKSFAYNEGKEELLDDEKDEKGEEDYDDDNDDNDQEVSKVSDNEQEESEATPRSSNLYQSESEHNDHDNNNVDEEDADEFDADPGTENCTSRSASVIDDEDIQFESEVD